MSKPFNRPFAQLRVTGMAPAREVRERRAQDAPMRIEDAEYILNRCLDHTVTPLEAVVDSGVGGPETDAAMAKINELLYPDEGGQVLDDQGLPVDTVAGLKELMKRSNRLFRVANHYTGQHLYIFELPVGYQAFPGVIPVQELESRGLLEHVRAERNGDTEIARGRGEAPKKVPNYGFVLDFHKAGVTRKDVSVNVVTLRCNEDYTAFTGWSAGTYTKDYPHARKSQLCRIHDSRPALQQVGITPAPATAVVTEVNTAPVSQPKD